MIPDFTEDGLLPPGTFEVKFNEIEKRCGGRVSMKRGELFRNLRSFWNYIKYHAKVVYIDGSFVTRKSAPNDVDLLVILPPEFYQEMANLRRLKGFLISPVYDNLHIFAFMEGHTRISYYFDLFTHDKVTRQPKGILKIQVQQ
jgi:hypothetical protein